MTSQFENTPGETATAIEAGKQLCKIEVRNEKGTAFAFVPRGVNVKELDFLRERPKHINGCSNFADAQSFIEYFDAFKTEYSVINYCIADASFLAIIDFHVDSNTPSWKEHCLAYKCETTREWDEWISKDGERMDQMEFALFTEKNLEEIREPSAAQMLETVLTLQSNKDITFKSGRRIANGQTQFAYNENLNDTAGANGTLEIPEELTLGIKVFEGSDVADSITAKFRYRIADGKILMWYDLVRPHKVHELAFNDILETMKNGTKPRLFLHVAK